MSHDPSYTPALNANELKYISLASSLRRNILAGAWPMGTKIPTEKELLDSTGLSLTTVRRAFQELVDEGLIERRRGAGTFVAQWRAKRHQPATSIGIVTPEIEAYFRHIIRGAQDHLTSVGIGTALLATYQWKPEQEQAAIDRLITGGVDGIIMTPSMEGPDQALMALHRLKQIEIPIILVERSTTWAGPLGRLEHVVSDHVGGAFDAIMYLNRLGHHEIGLIYRAGAYTSKGVVQGYREACEHLELTPWQFELPPKQYGNPHPPHVVDPAVEALMASSCTAVLVFGDREAALVQSKLLARGMSLPQEMSIISYDDETADLAPIPLTAVAPAKYQLGQLAARNLLKRIHHGDALPFEQTRLRPVLVERESTAPAP